MSALGEVVSCLYLFLGKCDHGRIWLTTAQGLTEEAHELTAHALAGSTASDGVDAVDTLAAVPRTVAEAAGIVGTAQTTVPGYLASIGAGFTATAASAAILAPSEGTWLRRTAAVHAEETGRDIGRKPNSRSTRNHVREVASAEELDALFTSLSAGGKALDKPTYPGSMVKLPDGTTIGYRTKSKTSPDPTLDIKTPKNDKIKVHINKEKWIAND
ncbi:hypothetical protein [Saccharopolyspora shandongensis]|uniref:hypothetical protein n=1 Tax=Saccharopolyspora shandongensis TaxID=418495 RepID=UPI0033D96346